MEATVTVPGETTSLNWFGMAVNDDQSSCYKLCTGTNAMLK